GEEPGKPGGVGVAVGGGRDAVAVGVAPHETFAREPRYGREDGQIDALGQGIEALLHELGVHGHARIREHGGDRQYADAVVHGPFRISPRKIRDFASQDSPRKKSASPAASVLGASRQAATARGNSSGSAKVRKRPRRTASGSGVATTGLPVARYSLSLSGLMLCVVLSTT